MMGLKGHGKFNQYPKLLTGMKNQHSLQLDEVGQYKNESGDDDEHNLVSNQMSQNKRNTKINQQKISKFVTNPDLQYLICYIEYTFILYI